MANGGILGDFIMNYKCKCGAMVTPITVVGKTGKSIYEWRCLRCRNIEVSEIRRVTLGFGALTEERRRILLKE